MTDARTIESTDGTPLAVQVTGDGPPLVLVHGSAADRSSWGLVEPLLAERYTVWAYDRRGRGGSGDSDEYAFEREVDDVGAVLAAAGDAHVVGHSFGGYLALGAAAFGGPRSVVVYEAPVHQERRAEAVERTIALIDRSEHEQAIRLFLPDVAGFSVDEVSTVASIPEVWDQLLGAAPTLRRELRALQARPWDANRYRSVAVPVLCVNGSLTDSPVYLSPDELAAAVPGAQRAVLEGQRHIGMATDPGGFAATVFSFTSA